MKTVHAFWFLFVLLGYTNPNFSQHWRKVYDEGNGLSHIQFADENTIYALDSYFSNDVLKSIDKGDTWEKVQSFDLGFYSIKGFKCKNADTLIFETTFHSPFSFDGMHTMDTLSLPGIEFYYSEFSWIGDKLYLSYVKEDTTRLLVKESFTEDWNELQLFIREPSDPYTPNLLQAYVNEDNAYFFSHYTNDRMYSSPDGGHTLIEHILSGDTISQYLTQMYHHPGHSYIYIPNSYEASLRISTETWEVNFMIDAVLDTLQIIDIDFYEDKVVALLADGQLIYSSDNGDSWIVDTIFDFAKNISINNAGDIMVTTVNAIYLRNAILSSNETLSNTFDFTIYPNPSKEIFHVLLPNPFELQTIYIYNTLGQKIYEGKDMQIHCGDWSAGVYYILIIDKENRSKINKITKE